MNKHIIALAFFQSMNWRTCELKVNPVFGAKRREAEALKADAEDLQAIERLENDLERKRGEK